MTATIYLQIFAGLGLFFVGINLLSDQLKNYGKPYIRKFIDALAGTDAKAILSGALSGAVTNSAKAVTFSLTGIVSSGLLNTRKALPIIIGASFGSSLLVLWISINFEMLDLVMLGLAGLYYQFSKQKSSSGKFLAGVLFGLGLVFFGLNMLKSGAANFKHDQEFMQLLGSTHGYWLLALLLGAVAAFVTQSGSTISIIAISFLDVGLFSFDQTIMFVYGTNIGSGFSTAMLGFGMGGRSRQLIMFHALIKIAGALILVPLLYLETYAHIPLLKQFVALFTPSHGTQVGTIYIIYEIISGLALWALLTPIGRWLNRFWPPTLEESLAQLKYISFADLRKVNKTIRLIEKEQARLLSRAQRYFDAVRPEIPAGDKIGFGALYEANKSIHKEIQHLISELANLNLSVHQSEDLLHRHSVQEWITALNRNLFELGKLFERGRKLSLSKTYTAEIIDNLSTLLGGASEAVGSEDPVVIRRLIDHIKQQETLINRFNPKELASDTSINIKTKKVLLGIIFYHERVVWIIDKLAHALASDREDTENGFTRLSEATTEMVINGDSPSL